MTESSNPDIHRISYNEEFDRFPFYRMNSSKKKSRLLPIQSSLLFFLIFM